MSHSWEMTETYCCLEVSDISSVVNYFLCEEYSSLYNHYFGILMNIFSDLTGFLHLIMWSILFSMTACFYTSLFFFLFCNVPHATIVINTFGEFNLCIIMRKSKRQIF